jgi:hypothetical protein
MRFFTGTVCACGKRGNARRYVAIWRVCVNFVAVEMRQILQIQNLCVSVA